MPQLDFAFYPSQLFWLAVTFALLYFVLAYIALPRLKNIQSERATATQGRRHQAEQAAARAEAALQNYEQKATDSKERAQNEGQNLRRQTDQQLQKTRDEAKNRLDQTIRQAEADIASFLPSGRKSAQQAAISATQDIMRHLTGADLSDQDARQAIENAIKKAST